MGLEMPPEEPQMSIGKEVTGIIVDSDQEEFDLSQDLEKEVLALIFSQESCYSCIQEAIEISQEIEKLGGLPSNVEIITILVGSPSMEEIPTVEKYVQYPMDIG